VLSTVTRDQRAARGEEWTDADDQAFQKPIRDRYEEQGSPYYATARLWDDGVIDPADTRTMLGLALDVVSRVPLADRGFGLFRM
jgi:3-methylcrotonyl-CoA carboxylase beta subunit